MTLADYTGWKPDLNPPPVKAGGILTFKTVEFYIDTHHFLAANGLVRFAPEWLERRGYDELQDRCRERPLLSIEDAEQITRETAVLIAILESDDLRAALDAAPEFDDSGTDAEPDEAEITETPEEKAERIAQADAARRGDEDADIPF